MNIRTRPVTVFILALLALGGGAWLRLHAFELSLFQRAASEGGGLIVSDERLAALTEIARVLLWSGAAMLSLSAGAWLFVPAFRSPRLHQQPVTGALVPHPAA